ncbi:MAG: MerR family transcriptional regulator, partial [Actinomycetes bacterium]
MTTGGAHLPIAEVLEALQTEFPDVTVTKIRFLESQGLIEPERTPSGYRKFYAEDVSRLRWILAEQRDHGSSLQELKARLAEFGPDGPPEVAPLADAPAPTPAATSPTAPTKTASGATTAVAAPTTSASGATTAVAAPTTSASGA